MSPAIHGIVFAGALALSVLGVSCDSTETPTSATTTTAAVTPAAPAFAEEFNGSIDVSGSSFYSFSVTQYGTVNLTLTSVVGTFVPSSVMLGLGIGTPGGTDCSTTTTITTRSGSTAQITGSYAEGVYCVKVSDVGNLFGPANFAVTIAYP